MSTARNNIIYCNFRTGNRSFRKESENFQEKNREDWSRFFVIQLHIYLSSKKSPRIGNRAEEDMIRDLLAVYWEEIMASGVIEDLSVLEKVKLFGSIKVDFPLVEIHVPDAFISHEG